MSPSAPPVLLTMRDFEAAHASLVGLFKDDAEPMPSWGAGDLSKIETLRHCSEVRYGGVQKYPEFHRKVAKFFYSGIKLHVFPNGNKRFGLMCTIYFLVLNGYRLRAEPGSASTIAKLVANADPHMPGGKPDHVVDLIADAYFKDHIHPHVEGESI